MTNKDWGLYLLRRRCDIILANQSLNPVDIVNICKDYTTTGCKSRGDYEYLVSYTSEWIPSIFRSALLQ